jgi:cation transport regulator ChaC
MTIDKPKTEEEVRAYLERREQVRNAHRNGRIVKIQKNRKKVGH